MKLKLDENMPAALVPALEQLGHDIDTVPKEGLSGEDDPVVWKACQGAGRFLITQDLDFSDRRQFLPGTHHGILVVRLHRPSRLLLTRRLLQIFRTEQVETWAGCFVVVTDHKIRIRRS